MRTRVESEPPRAQSVAESQPATLAFQAVAPTAVFDPDADLGNALPSDHPAWVRDAVSISQRARQILATLRPVAVRVLTLWDHVTRSIVVGGRRLEIDASGSYRMP